MNTVIFKVKIMAAAVLTAAILVSAASCSESSSSSEQPTTAVSYDPIPVDSRTNDKVGFQLEKPKSGEEIAVITVKDFGEMKIRLFPDSAPKTVENFKALVNSGFYNGKTFYDVEKNVKILAGDSESNNSAVGTPVEDEFNANLINLSGAVSMYSDGENTAGNRFFINTVSADYFNNTTTRNSLRLSLDGYLKAIAQYETKYREKYGEDWAEYAAQDMNGSAVDPRKVDDETFALYQENGGNLNYDGALSVYGIGKTVFGQIFEGYDVAEKISQVQVDSDFRPKSDIVIEKIEIVIYK